MTDVIVRIEHVRACGFCSRGTRQWFARHGLDWSEFVAQGLPASVFEATGDGLGLKVVQKAREGAGNE